MNVLISICLILLAVALCGAFGRVVIWLHNGRRIRYRRWVDGELIEDDMRA